MFHSKLLHRPRKMIIHHAYSGNCTDLLQPGFYEARHCKSMKNTSN